jgi:hypothetical protein
VGFKPTITVFERTKKVHASDRAATVIGVCATVASSKRGRFLERKTFVINIAVTVNLDFIFSFKIFVEKN